MVKTDDKITSMQKDTITEEAFFTYDEEEKQQREIDSENARLVFAPEFIPFYPSIKKEYKLTELEALLYGFIRFYMGTGGNKRFYFTNEQLGTLLDCTPTYISKAIKRLEDNDLIKTSRRVKANGGMIRFISGLQKVQSRVAQSAISKVQKVQGNKNKIKENKINLVTNVTRKDDVLFGNKDVNEGITLFETHYGHLSRQMLHRYALHRLYRDRGKDRVFKALLFVVQHRDDRFCPVVSNPLDLEEKWIDLETYARRLVKGGGNNGRHFDAEAELERRRLARSRGQEGLPADTGTI